MKQMRHLCSIHTVAFLLLFALSYSGSSNGEAVQFNTGTTDSYKTGEYSENSDYYLREARSKLGHAFDSYRQGDRASAETSLEEATAYLNKAAENSSTEKAREEARNLAAEIDNFRNRISQASDQQENSIARFWHRASSIIKREADQLIHSYKEISTAEKTLKHLLDAKMHLFNAEHDLFVSHDTEEAEEELGKVIKYLSEAGHVATPATKDRIDQLSGDIQSLKEKIASTSGIWKKDNVINSLDAALASLANANESATPATKLRIEQIQEEMQALRADVRRNSIRDDYDSSMATIRSIINEL